MLTLLSKNLTGNGVLPFKNMNLKNRLEKFKVNVAEKVDSLLGSVSLIDKNLIIFSMAFIYSMFFIVTYSLGISLEIHAFLRRFLILIALLAFIYHYYVTKIKNI